MAVFNLGGADRFGGLAGLFGLLAARGGTAKLSDPGAPPAKRQITPEVAMQLSTVWSCVRLLSETIGSLPVGVFSKDASGRKQPYQQHGLYKLVHDQPNTDQSSAEFWEAVVVLLCLKGNFYAEKFTLGGDVKALNPMPGDVQVYRNDNGERRYRYAFQGGREDLGESDVFHVRGFGAGGDVGLSPIGYARCSLGAAWDANDAAATAFENGVRGSGFLIVPGKPTAEQKEGLRKTFLDPVTGRGSSGRAGVLEQGMDWKGLTGLPPEDLQLLQTRGFNVEEICRWFRVPPFMVGHTEKSTSWGTGLEQQTLGFLTYSLQPYLTRIEKAVSLQLLRPEERGSVYAEFNLEGLLRADSTGRAALYSTLTQNGIYSRNEVRARENLPPVDGGDELTVQSNLIPLSRLGETPPAEAAARSALRAWLAPEASDAA